MVFSLYFFLSWLMLYLLLSIKGNPLFKPLSFLFLVSLLIHNHLYILIPENWKGFNLSNKVELYLAFLLYKTILVPSSLVLIYKETSKKLVGSKFFTGPSFIFVHYHFYHYFYYLCFLNWREPKKYDCRKSI
jgi:hypothetical protein